MTPRNDFTYVYFCVASYVTFFLLLIAGRSSLSSESYRAGRPGGLVVTLEFSSVRVKRNP